MNSISSYLFSEFRQVRTINLFRKALYLLLVYKAMLMAAWYHELLGPQRLIYLKPLVFSGCRDIAYLLNCTESNALRIVFLTLMGLISIAGLFNVQHVLLRVTLYLAVLNLHHAVYPTLSAGDLLLNQLLFFNIFLFTTLPSSAMLKDLQSAVHHTAFAGIRLQVCLMYFISSYYKWGDAGWLHGQAVYDALHVQAFSLPCLQHLPDVIYVFMNFFVLLYQSAFPVLVWLKPIKPYILAIGIVQHLFIAFGMGLFQFSLIVMICYLLFLDLDQKKS